VAGPLKLGAQALAVAGVGMLAAILVWRLTHPTPPPKIGERAPAFSLQRLSGNGQISLASLRGKTVVLNFFASWCRPCKSEAPALERFWRENRGRKVVVLGVDSNDSRGDALRFVRAHRVTYPVVSDPNGQVAGNSYDIANLPSTYVLNGRGRLVGGEILGPVSDHAYAQTLARYVDAALKA
jgi:cytochrome c biogenesis protein CcmG, thiol:disulfide interchange protein DsbE